MSASVLDLLASADDAPSLLGVDPARALTRAELRHHVWSVGAMLRARGIQRSDVVLVSMPNGPECLASILGVMGAAVCAPMNPAYTLEELAALAQELGAVAILTGENDTGPAAQLSAKASIHHLSALAFAPGPEGVLPTDSPTDGDIALVLHTAGTTAQPKQVPLSHANLVAAAKNVVASLNLGPADRCLNVMPFFHSHGLIGAALSTLASGGSILCSPGMDPRRFFTWAEQFGCTWYTAASTIHRLVLEADGGWDGFRFMRSASGPLAPQLARAMEERCGAPMIEVYGMTEAYQIAANALPPGERRPGSVGRATGTTIAVLDAAGEISDTGDGEILVRGPAVFRGYSSPADANGDAFVDGWFRTGDLGRLETDGRLTITGRAKEQINRAGEKVSPREVEEAILDCPEIAEAVVFGVPDEMLGEDIVACVVAADGVEVSIPAMRAALAHRIAPFKVPRHVIVVPHIPKSDTGKPQRRLLASDFTAGRLVSDLTDSRPSPTAESLSPDEARLAHIWQSVLKAPSLPSGTDRFFDLGGDSLAVMEMVVAIHREFGVDLPLVDVHTIPTLSELARHIATVDASGPSQALLTRYQRGNTGTCVVLVPGQAGHAVGLDLIADAIGAGPSIHLFDYPGHRPGQSPAVTIEEIAERLVQEIEAAGLRGRLILYGNSMGAWVALEAARILDARGRRPVVVGVGDLYSPWFNTHRDGVRPPFSHRVLNRLRRLIRHIRHARAGHVPGDPASPARQREASVSHASSLAQRAHRDHPYRGDLLVVSTAPRAQRFGDTLGYDRHVAGVITTLSVAGDHNDMHRLQATPIGEALRRYVR